MLCFFLAPQGNAFEQRVRPKDLPKIFYTSVAIENAQQGVVAVGEGRDRNSSILHVLPPAWVAKRVPHMWETAKLWSRLASCWVCLVSSGSDRKDPIEIIKFLLRNYSVLACWIDFYPLKLPPSKTLITQHIITNNLNALTGLSLRL